MKPFQSLALLLSLLCLASQASAQADTVRIRGEITAVSASEITLRERSGEMITLALVDKMPVAEVYPITMADIKPNSYIGTAAMPQADGSLVALEVLVFPESARGVGEGHRGWDLMPQSTMTNATVSGMAQSALGAGQALTLTYKDGQKTVLVPNNVPIVTTKPGDASLLVLGAKVLVTAQMKDGKATALRITAGRNGFAPPM